jgi:glycosyltransferase involved in cell wall biosynthesis
VISGSVAADALAAGFPADRIHVVAPRPSFEPDELALDPAEVVRRFELPTPFFLVSNQFWQHKNHGLVLEALRRAHDTGCRPNVVFTGRTSDYRDQGYFDALLARLSSLGLWSSCRLLGRLPRAEQLALLRAARAVIQPSLFEGRGLIAEEALALGVPVLCSRIPVHAALAGSRCTLFDPRSPEQLATLIKRPFPSERRTTAEILDASRTGALAYGGELLDVVTAVRGAAGVRGM